jgi:hypothetical protein
MRATFKDEYFSIPSFLTVSSMRISKESLFNILNLQTIANDESMINLFSQRGDAEYVIEVVGISPPLHTGKF